MTEHETHERHETPRGEIRPGPAAGPRVLFPSEGYAIRGAVFEVYSHLGTGLAEAVYQEALEMEFTERGIPFAPQPALDVRYKGKILRQTFRPDFVCYGKIIVEIKSVKSVLPEHEAQAINYLRLSGFRLGFLVNFSNYPMAYVKQFAN